MAKKILLLLSCVFCLQLAVAQKMSDDQIMKYVLSEQEKGVSQNEIAKQLLQKGVTPAQLREIKKKYNAEKNLLGASDLLGSGNESNRLREKREETEELRQKRDAGLVVSNREKSKKYSEEEQLNMLNDEMEFLDIDSIQYYNDKLSSKSQVFGRNIFNNELLTFEPAYNIPTPADYVLGAGDQVFIDVWGASENLVDAIISPDGKIIVEGVGPLHLAGKSVEAANKYVNDVLSTRYAESSISLTVGLVRSIQVQVLGEVVAPGSYTLSALSTAFNALYAAGGITDIGTLRSINVFRNGKSIATIDVYDFIFNGNNTGNIRLQDNDVINVGAYTSVVNIQGKVKRPMKYEMLADEPLAKLLKYTGGFTGDAYDEKLRVVRKSGREYSLYTVDKKNMSAFTLCDGDSVHVDSVIPRFSNMVEVNGAVFFPGQYQFGEDVKTLKELIAAAGGVREDAFLNRAVLHHRNPDNTIDAKSIDLNGILNGTVADIELRNNDVLFVPSETEMKGEQTITVSGEVRFPGEYKFANNTKIEDIILQAGGLTDKASAVKIEVFRQLYDQFALSKSNEITDVYTFEVKNGFVVEGGSDFVLEPYDVVYVRRNPQRTDIQTVRIQGAVNFEGDFAITSKKYRISDLLQAAGGLIEQAYIDGAYILRRMTETEKTQRNTLAKITRNSLYEDMLKSNANIDMNTLETLSNSKINLNDWYSVPVELDRVIKKPGCDDDLLLRAGDVLYIPEYNSTIKISGEVEYPTTINWFEGKSLKYYINQAGGYTSGAKKKKVYAVYMDGSVKKLSRFSKKSVKPGCEIVVPRKAVRKRMSTGEIVTISTGTASLATMLVTLVNLLR